MKKLFLILMLACAAPFAFAQTITFKGTVPPGGKEKEVEIKEAQVTFATIPVKEDGTFYGEVPLAKIKQIQASYGLCSKPIIAKPGRIITIDFGTEPKTGTMTGSPETDLYIDMRFVIYPADINIVWDMPWHVYKKYNQDGLISKLKYCDAFCKAQGDISEAYIKEIKQNARYVSYGSLIMWPQFRKNKGPFTEADEADWKAHLESLMAEVEWNDPFLCGIPSYVSFAEYALNQDIEKRGGTGSFILRAYDVVKEKVANKDVAEFFMFHYTKKYMKDEPASSQQAVIDAFKKDVTNQKYLSGLDGILKDAKRFGNDAQAFDFTLEDVNGKKVTLSSFKGKVVYMDFWATWCAPCRGEIPHMNKLKEELKGNKDIVIICVSVDQPKDKEKWKAMVAEMGMGDYQVFAGDQAAEIKKNYNVSGIPHFTMIGKDGKIYKNQTVRPSNPQTKSILLDLAK